MPEWSSAPAKARPQLVERDEQLRLLDRLLDVARGGSGSLVVLRGEAGIGKTSLLQAFLVDAADRAAMAVGYCDPVATPRPFSPFHDMTSVLGTELTSLFSDRTTRDALQDWLLRQLQARTTVVAIEDIQWADDATLDLVRLLARRVPETRSLVILTCRDDAAGEGVTRLLGQLATSAAAHQVALPPLSTDAVAKMAIGTRLDPSELHRLTAGNPFFASEVVAAGGGSVPATVRDLIRSRVVELGVGTRRALEAAAILGSRVESWLLAAVSGEDLPGIDEAVAASLVDIDGHEIVFHHELTRLAVLDDLPAVRAIGLHRAALVAMRRGGVSDAARLAHHAEGAADGPAVLEHAVPAASQALHTGAYREGIAQLERALRFATDSGVRVELLELLGDAFMGVSNGRDADRAWSEALALRRGRNDDPRTIGDLMRRLSRAAWWEADADRSWRLARDAIEVLEPLGESAELAMAYSALSQRLMVAQVAEEAIAWGERALVLADRLELEDVRAHAMNNIGSAEIMMGRPEGLAKLEGSLAIARRTGNSDHICRALMNLATTAANSHQLRRADAYFTELAEFSEVSEVVSCNLDASRSEVLLHLGEWEAAEAAVERAMRLRDRISPVDASVALSVLARLNARRGEPGATALADEAEEVVGDGLVLPMEWGVLRSRAEIAFVADDWSDLVGPLRSLYARALASHDPWIMGDAARWLRLAGDPVAAAPHMARPYRHELLGDWREAAREWERLDNPYEAAFVRLAGDDPAEVRAAHGALLRLGAFAVAARAARRLQELGAPVPRGPRRTTGSHPALLTVREAEIADFMAEGLSNREIASRLVLSEKTVGHHASAVLAKLGVHRRAEVARALERMVAASA
jgi:DNA-binding CsgD family transcriptional regulator/tetratricopeptide (TPR) repeat protein